MQVEAKKQSDRSGRNTPGQSMTSTSMFSTFREDVNFPPIIDSAAYKQNKHLGLCKKINAPTESESTTDRSRSDTSLQINQVFVESQMMDEPNIQIPTPVSSISNISSQGSSQQQPMTPSAPGFITPPPPGGILPPSPMGIGKLLQNSEQKRKDIEAGIIPPYNFAQDNGFGQEREPQSNLSYKDQLGMMIAKTQGVPMQSQPGPSLLDDPAEVKKRSILATALAGQAQKASAGGFFDDEDDEADLQPSLLKKKKKPTEITTYDFDDESPPVKLDETEKPQVRGTLLDTILTGDKPKKKVIEEEENPFTKRLTKPKKTLFEDDDEKSEDEDLGKKRKVDKFLADDSDEEKERAKLLKKYGKDAPKKTLQDSDDEIPMPKIGKPKDEQKKKDSKKATFLDESDDEVPLPKPKQKKKEEPSAKKPPAMDFTVDQPIENEIPAKKSPEIKLSSSEKQSVKPDPFIQKEPEIQESIPVRVSVKKSTDFLSKLNAQLVVGPKENAGLVKSIVGENIEEAQEGQPVDEEPNLLNPQYRPMRGSVDERGTVKPVAQVYHENEEDIWKTAPGQNIVPYRPSTNKLSSDRGSDSLINTSKPTSKRQSMVIQDTSEYNSVPVPVKKVKNAEPKPAPEAPKPDPSAPAMLRGKRKDPFASSSGSDEDEPAPPVKKPEVEQPEKPKEVPKVAEVKPKEETSATPTMLRGNRKKDRFASSESEEDEVKPPPKPRQPTPPQRATEGRKNKLLASTEEPEKPKEAPKKTPIKKPTLLADDSEDDIPVKKPVAGNKTKKVLLGDSEDDMPPMPKKKPPPMLAESSDDDKPKAKAKAANAGKKKKLFDDDSDD